jgi:hypothetical protein
MERYKMKNTFENIKISDILVKALSGSLIDDCILEGVELATKENRKVVLIHNEHKYKIDPKKIVQFIKGEN